jgi:hypothetical protein
MWKVLVGIVMATAVIAASVILYPMRNRLFRPDVNRVGGTRLVLDVKGDAGAVADAYRQRFDPKDTEGIVLRAEEGRIEVDVPTARRHGENLERVKRLAGRVGRFKVGIIAHDKDDAGAIAAGKKWLAVPANRKALEDAQSKGEPLPAFEGEFKGKGPGDPAARYEWAWTDWERAARMHGMFGRGVGSARDQFPLVHSVSVAGREHLFTLVRQLPDAEGLTNADVRPRIHSMSRSSYGTQMQLRIEADGRRRLSALVSKYGTPAVPNPRWVALLIDSELLFHHDLMTKHEVYYPLLNTAADAEDLMALFRAPLPAGTKVSIEKEETLAGR